MFSVNLIQNTLAETTNKISFDMSNNHHISLLLEVGSRQLTRNHLSKDPIVVFLNYISVDSRCLLLRKFFLMERISLKETMG